MRRFVYAFALAWTLAPAAAWAVQDVVNTRHNLSVSGPGTIKSTAVDKVCIFCHTPHNTTGAAPLWNRADPGEIYTPYDSSTQFAPPIGAPSGESRLCLSCHDGTIALGDLQNPPGANDLNTRRLMSTDRGYLGTDLSDDHPISFAYDAALFGANQELMHPAGIELPLENITGQPHLQCTTCHDPHEKDVVPFLRVSTADGTLCTKCHDKAGWTGSTHESSIAAVAPTDLDTRRPEWVASTVAGNACMSCHTPHNGQPSTNPDRLLVKLEENTCYGCHDANGPGTDIQAEFTGPLKVSVHPVDIDNTGPNGHDATRVENPATMSLHVECMDCHNPHSVTPGAPPMISFNPNNPSDPNHSTPPAANSLIQGVTGIDINGNPTASVTNQYELCFKCHGRLGQGPCGGAPTTRCTTAASRSMTRVDRVYNIRDKVNGGNPNLVSWHPIESNDPSNNAEVPSLRNDVPGMNRTTGLIYCTDCHNSDQSAAAGGSGPNGPHGSTNDALLAQEYSFDPALGYSPNLFELCYKCHSEASILSDASFGEHRLHVEQTDKACVNCHDPHGSQRSQHLLNFQINSSVGGAWAMTSDCGGGLGSCGRPEPTWEDNGPFSGTCWVNCHERDNTRREPHNGGGGGYTY